MWRDEDVLCVRVQNIKYARMWRSWYTSARSGSTISVAIECHDDEHVRMALKVSCKESFPTTTTTTKTPRSAKQWRSRTSSSRRPHCCVRSPPLPPSRRPFMIQDARAAVKVEETILILHDSRRYDDDALVGWLLLRLLLPSAVQNWAFPFSQRVAHASLWRLLYTFTTALLTFEIIKSSYIDFLAMPTDILFNRRAKCHSNCAVNQCNDTILR